MGEIDLTDAWKDWRETCALDLCSPDHISELCVVSNSKYIEATEKLRKDQATIEPFVPYDNDSSFRRTFHIMEAECIPLGTKEERQRYKDRIFAGASEIGQVTGYFLRDFFRSYVKRPKNLSYKKPLAPEGNPQEEWDDLLVRGDYIKSTRDPSFKEQETLAPYPDDDSRPPTENETPLDSTPAPKHRKRKGMPGNIRTSDMEEDSAVESIDYQDISIIAKKFWTELTEADRAALYTSAHNIAMSHPELLKKVGRKKSSFIKRPIVLLTQVRNNHCSDMEQEEQMHFIGTFLDTLAPCYQEWEKTSELGKWIVEHFHYGTTNGKKQRFSSSEPDI